MSIPIKFPPARQPATDPDANGRGMFTRPWLLFFQAVYDRIGGTTAMTNTELGAALFEDAGSSETTSILFTSEMSISQNPTQSQTANVIETIVAELSAQRDLISELMKEINSLKQGIVS